VIYFDQASGLSQAEEDKIKAIAPILREVLSKRADYNIYIIGHTDVTEPDEAKQRTSLARASEVRYALMRAGLPEERILIEAAGDLKPHKVKSFPVGQYLDRRAEIYLDAPPLIQTEQP
jgi:outer membrane protein OmpA-like peptidoglycan-associated protein